MDIKTINEMIQRESAFVDTLTGEVGKVIVGQKQMVDRLLIGFCTGDLRPRYTSTPATRCRRACSPPLSKRRSRRDDRNNTNAE